MPREALISVRGLEVQARIGVTDAELEIKRPILIDITLSLEDCKATGTDAIDGTVDYAAAASLAAALARVRPHRTLERLAARIADELAARFDVGAEVTVAKPGPPMEESAEFVAVTVRSKQ